MLNDFLPTYNLKTFQRCQVAARTIANALRDICKKILIERSLAQVIGKVLDFCVDMTFPPYPQLLIIYLSDDILVIFSVIEQVD